MKTKVFIALSVRLPWVEDRYRGNNGNCQYTVLIKTTTIKKCCEILDMSYAHLKYFCRIHTEDHAQFTDICKLENTIYYHVEHCRSGYINKWFADHRVLSLKK